MADITLSAQIGRSGASLSLGQRIANFFARYRWQRFQLKARR